MDTIRAAANSIAKAIPSRRRQISMTAAASSGSSSPNPGGTARARSTNNSTAAEPTPAATSRDGTGHTCSADTSSKHTPTARARCRLSRRVQITENSANEARMLKNILPNGSAGSYTVRPICSRAPRLMMRSARERASGIDRANRSSLGTIRASPECTAASAWSRPGRPVLAPVNPSST